MVDCSYPQCEETPDVSVFLIIGKDVMDPDAPDHAPVRLGTETTYHHDYRCDTHDPGPGERGALVDDTWQVLEDESERLPWSR